MNACQRPSLNGLVTPNPSPASILPSFRHHVFVGTMGTMAEYGEYGRPTGRVSAVGRVFPYFAPYFAHTRCGKYGKYGRSIGRLLSDDGGVVPLMRVQGIAGRPGPPDRSPASMPRTFSQQVFVRNMRDHEGA